MREDIGLTFSAALRSFLRQDPDVILVGEMRDLETAQIAIRAALTGHLVFSTLHTNDAPSTVTRLQDMGIPPFLISSSLLLVIAQRLCRKICSDCRDTATVSRGALLDVGFKKPEQVANLTLHFGRGCTNCWGTGYRGRVVVAELPEVTPDNPGSHRPAAARAGDPRDRSRAGNADSPRGGAAQGRGGRHHGRRDHPRDLRQLTGRGRTSRLRRGERR